YDVGLTNAFDFSQSKLRYDNAQIELARSKYDYIFRIKVLELYFGVPVTELKF
ncbi:MAG: TolC family protein, partial [Dokdonia donghaensis]|nr:TolC family protein [Dokdonia donghaensis]